MLIYSLLVMAAVSEARIARPIHADVPNWQMTRHGLASPSPTLGYDLPALAFFLRPQSSGAAPRLDYADYDQPGEWSDAEIAALFVRTDDRRPAIEDPAADLDIMDENQPTDPAVVREVDEERAVDEDLVIDADPIAGDVTADQTMPDQTVPDQITPEQITPDETLPG